MMPVSLLSVWLAAVAVGVTSAASTWQSVDSNNTESWLYRDIAVVQPRNHHASDPVAEVTDADIGRLFHVSGNVPISQARIVLFGENHTMAEHRELQRRFTDALGRPGDRILVEGASMFSELSCQHAELGFDGRFECAGWEITERYEAARQGVIDNSRWADCKESAADQLTAMVEQIEATHHTNLRLLDRFRAQVAVASSNVRAAEAQLREPILRTTSAGRKLLVRTVEVYLEALDNERRQKEQLEESSRSLEEMYQQQLVLVQGVREELATARAQIAEKRAASLAMLRSKLVVQGRNQGLILTLAMSPCTQSLGASSKGNAPSKCFVVAGAAHLVPPRELLGSDDRIKRGPIDMDRVLPTDDVAELRRFLDVHPHVILVPKTLP